MAQKHRSEHRVAGVVWPRPKEMGWISEEIQEQACEKQRTRLRETSGLVSLVGVLLKKCSNFVQKTPPFSQGPGGPPRNEWCRSNLFPLYLPCFQTATAGKRY